MAKGMSNGDGDPTTVQVSRLTWKRLNAKKEPGESFDDTIDRVLDGYETVEVSAAWERLETAGLEDETPTETLARILDTHESVTDGKQDSVEANA